MSDPNPFDDPTHSRAQASLTVGEQLFEVLVVEGREALSQPFRFEVCCPTDLIQPSELIGQRAALSLGDGFGAIRTIRGVVTSARISLTGDTRSRIFVTIEPALALLRVGKDCRAFTDRSVPEIARWVLSDQAARNGTFRGAHTELWRLADTYEPRQYVAQYREDDLAFLQRLFEEEGIYFYYSHDGESSELVIADRSIGAGDIEGGGSIPFAVESGLRAAGEAISELTARVSATPTRFTIGSFDPAKPSAMPRATEGNAGREVYDAPRAGPSTFGMVRARARIAHEAALAKRQAFEGDSTSVRLVPGFAFEVLGHPVLGDPHLFVTQTTLRLDVRRGPSGPVAERPLSCRFVAQRADVAFRSPLERAPGSQAGLQTGVVTGASGEEIHTDEQGRVRVQLHWDRLGRRDDRSGTWMRVAQRGTANSLLIPRVGWNVMTYNEEGAADGPSVMSRFHDVEHPPAYPLPENKTRVVFKTATTPGGGSFNEIYFEDKKASEELFVNASRDMTVLVQNTKSESVTRDSTRSVGAEHVLDVSVDSTEEIGGSQTVSIGASETVTVAKGRKKSVGAAELVTIAGSRSLDVGGTNSDTVVNKRTLKVGSALIDTTLGPIAAASGKKMSLKTGGARIVVSAKSISESAKVLSVQTVGGAKIEIALKRRVLKARLRVQEQVGGALIIRSDGVLVEQASSKAKYSVAGSLDIEAPSVSITGRKKVEISCGASAIVVTPSSVEIRTPSLDLGGSVIDAESSGPILHN